MANQTTKLADLINPQVMADMISAKIPNKIVVTPFAKIDNTLQGRPGDTITVPQYKYIGDAETVAEGAACETNKLESSTAQYSVEKAMKAVDLTDEAVLSGYGNPVGEANNQLAKSIASKIDNDAIAVLNDATTVYNGTAKQIGYAGVVNAVDLFNEEVQTDKVMFVNPHQLTTLRLDPDFISADKYGAGQNVMLRGEIGMISGVRIVPSRKVVQHEAQSAQGTQGQEGYVPAIPAHYVNPIIQLTVDSETEDETAALTIYMKRGINVETERDTLKRTTTISVDEHYTVALTDMSKVVLAKFAVAAG